MDLVFILIIIFFAGFIQGATGFGFGLVAVSLLSFFLNVKDASILLVIPAFCLNTVIFWRFRKHFKMERILPLIISSLFGVPIGIYFLVNASQTTVTKVLGVLLLITVLQRMFSVISNKRWNQYYLGIPCGIFSGMISGAFATGGPPIVAYVSNQKFGRLRCSASIQMVLGISAISRCIFLAGEGFLTPKLLQLGGSGIICSVGGALCGTLVLERISDRVANTIISVLLFILAAKYLFF